MEVICTVIKSGTANYADGTNMAEMDLIGGDRIGGTEDQASAREFDFTLRFSTPSDLQPFLVPFGKRVKITFEILEDVG